MIHKFVVTLKNRNQKLVDRFSSLIMAISAILFIQSIIIAKEINYILSAILLIMIIAFTVEIRKQIKQGKPVSFRIPLLLTAVAWIAMPYMKWLSAPLVLLAFIEKQAKFPLEVGFTDEEITLNTLIKKRFLWNEFNNIVLKDGFLTLDLKNNKLIQQEVLDDEDDDGDEDEFNEYCRQQLSKPSFN